MHYRKAFGGRMEVSEISLGCMSFENGKMADAVIREAHENGINLLDTADLYGRGDNEKWVGRAISGIREEFCVVTKVGNDWTGREEGWQWNPRRKYIMQAVEDSLRRLNIKHIDVYQLHGGTIEDPIEEVIETFEMLKDQGKILHYGISSIRPNVVRRWTADSRMSALMTQYSLLDRRPEEEILRRAADAGVSVLVRGALARGLLINKPATDYLNYTGKEISELHKYLQQQEQSPLTLAVDYALHHNAVTTATIGIRTPKQLREVLNAYKMREGNIPSGLTDILRPLHYTDHR